MRTTDALRQLTRNERDEADDDEYEEWLIIKVPTRQRLKYFMVDYCDGDVEDEVGRPLPSERMDYSGPNEEKVISKVQN